MRRLILASTLVVATTAGTAACATKGFVNTRVDNVDSKVTTLTGSLEETQARTKQNEGRISEVDQKAGAAQATASSAATAAGTAAERAAAAEKEAKAVGARTDELAAASRKLVYEVVLSEDSGNFRFNAVTLPDEAKAKIDAMITQLLADPKGSYFEIEGHTDNTGPTELNERIGLERAEAVKRYLYEAHKIPLHKMNVISFGEAKPASPNNTRDGRAQNRRIVIRVLG
jgi:outer membrane protein OmpA-like peptidoglycan-associated protein